MQMKFLVIPFLLLPISLSLLQPRLLPRSPVQVSLPVPPFISPSLPPSRKRSWRQFFHLFIIILYLATASSLLFCLAMETFGTKISLRGRIVGMREQGASISSIARDLGLTRNTVRKWCNRWEEEGDLRDHSRCGGPRKTSAADDQRIIDEATRNPLTNAVAIRYALHLGVSSYAQRYAQEGLQFWARVIFSDEKTFVSNTHSRLHCWRPNNTRYNRENIYEEARSGHVTCNMWGWVHMFGIGELAEIEGRFTAEK